MHINVILHSLNTKLAGENLMYTQALPFLDSVIDDINDNLNAKYPAFSEFNKDEYPKFPNYNFFPDKYIRSVVVLGAAYKFLTTDEEGISTANQFMWEYKDALFKMQRDWSAHVSLPYMDCCENGTLDICDDGTGYDWDNNGGAFEW